MNLYHFFYSLFSILYHFVYKTKFYGFILLTPMFEEEFVNAMNNS